MAPAYPKPNRHPPSPSTEQAGDTQGGCGVDPRKGDQLSLSPAFHWSKKGGDLRALLNRVIVTNRMAVADLAEETGIDEKQIGRALKDDGGAHPPLALVACVLWHDKAGVFLSGLADKLGYEVRPKTPDLAAENRRLRTALADAIKALQEAQP